MRLNLFLFVAAAGLTACAAPAPAEVKDVTGSLQKLTAGAISAPDATAIKIENPQRFPAKWQWRATYQGKSFDCDSDNQFRLPSCMAVS